jgi:hypothetical protein
MYIGSNECKLNYSRQRRTLVKSKHEALAAWSGGIVSAYVLPRRLELWIVRSNPARVGVVALMYCF